MKIRIVLDTIGTVLKILSLLMLVPGIVAAIYHETSGIAAFALASLLCLATGILFRRLGTKGEVGTKEAFGAVSLGWLFATFFGALPFVFQGIGFVDAMFESISGFSATGATILSESNAQGYYIVNSTLANNSISSAIARAVSGNLAGSTPYLAINVSLDLLVQRQTLSQRHDFPGKGKNHNFSDYNILELHPILPSEIVFIIQAGPTPGATKYSTL